MDVNALYAEALQLTKELVAIPSINSSKGGEAEIARFLERKLRELPYFQKHPERVIVQPLKDDLLERSNVFGIVTGEKMPSNRTILLHAHMDTVDVEDYGVWKSFAFSCDELTKIMGTEAPDEEVRRDAQSGEWLFGRGVADMKCGIAVHYAVLHYLTEHLDDFSGNVIWMSNPVEENQHTGIRNAVELLAQWKFTNQFDYVMAINNDYIAPAYPGDTANYFHAGSVGKILPCFYCVGKPTHAGEALGGISVSRVLAEIVQEMDSNTAYCDAYHGEYTSPPVPLKVEDLKQSYDVQTAHSAFVYFNYLIHARSMSEIFSSLKKVAQNALQKTIDYTNAQYRNYCKMIGATYDKLEITTEVLDYHELYQRVEEQYKGDLAERVRLIAEKAMQASVDARDISCLIVSELCKMAKIYQPTVVVFLAPPYCPYNTLHLESEKEKVLFDTLNRFLEDESQKFDRNFKLNHFFPVLSDSSYLKTDDDPDSVRVLKENFPAMDQLFSMPMETIQELHIPAVNFGCMGKDAHKWTERVNLPYTFGILPQVILHAVLKWTEEGFDH